MKKEESKMVCFLGGTCNDSKWRESLIKELEIGYYNPVVEDWTEECMEEEIKQREECDFCLYVITPRMTGTYSIAEAVDDSNKRPEKTIFCHLVCDQDFDDPEVSIVFDKFQNKSLIRVGTMIKENGGEYFTNLRDVADYLNGAPLV